MQSNKYNNPPTDEDWRRVKSIFTRLYLDDKKMLRDVISELEQKHGFRATVNMYEKRIHAWGLDRKLKQHEVEKILGIRRQRRAQGKDTVFILRGRRVDIQDIDRYVRRKGMSVSQLEERFMNGQSKNCPALEVFSPQSVQPCLAPPALPDSLEHFLREAKDLQLGSLDAGLCRANEDGIRYPWTEATWEIRDLANAFIGGTRTGVDPTLVRRLALLLERAVEVYDIQSLWDTLYMMTSIARAGYDTMAQSILDHLQRLIDVKLRDPRPQFRFFQQMARLRPTQLFDALIALTDLTVDIHVELKPGDAKFHTRSKVTSLLMRCPLGLLVEPFSANKLLSQCLQLFGPLGASCLQVLPYLLYYYPEALEMPAVRETLAYLAPEHLVYESPSSGLIFQDKRLARWEARCIADVYRLSGARREAAWTMEKLLESRILYELTLGQEHSLLVLLEIIADWATPERAGAWSERKREIEDIWTGELEAAAPDDDLTAACNVVSHTSR